MKSFQSESLFESQEINTEPCSHIVRVAFEAGVDSEFDYLVPDRLWPIKTGQRVEVPFGIGNKLQTAFCVAADIQPEESFIARGKERLLKKVTGVADTQPLLDKSLLKLADWISSYYVCPLGQVLFALVPAPVKKGIGVKKKKLVYLASPSQQNTESLKSKKQKQIVSILFDMQSFSADSAIELDSLLSRAACTLSPVQTLARKDIVKLVLKEILPTLPVISETMVLKTREVTLNADQLKALEHINEQLDSGRFGVTVLFGVTDSGKTEVYINAIQSVLQKGKTAIVLLPEIALTAQTVQRFSGRFERIAVMHSALTASQRNAQWHKIKTGQADVVIGARSAIFAPLQNLGLVIVDEEHEPSYKQDTVPRYNGRDVAIKRAQLENAHCILGSATPSLESLYNCKKKKYFTLLNLPKRVMNFPFPKIELINMRNQISSSSLELVSPPLADCLKQTLEKSEQAILLLNRRGYSNLILCSACKYTLHCRNCDVTLTFHKSSDKIRPFLQTITGRHLDYGSAVCHHCGSKTLVPQNCPLCGRPMIMIGLGTQRLEEELKKKFPQARMARVDSDSMAGADYYRLLKDFSDGRIDILAGTQILAKGLHFPNVTLVGIISADTCLYLPDFRSNERTFQLITQVAGRAGRCEKKGLVLVQTFLPEQPAIRFALDGNFSAFVNEELKHRKACNLPPYWRLAVITLRDRKYEKLEAASKALRNKIDSIIRRNNIKAVLRGPMPAVISRIQRFHRMQIIIQAPVAETIRGLFSALRQEAPIRAAVQTTVDIDPLNLL